MFDPASFLLITLDSCRYDTFEAADAPSLKALGPYHRAMAPGNFTYTSHTAIFVGFTPGIGERAEPFVNPKFGKVFRTVSPGVASQPRDFMTVEGANIVDGLKRLGYHTLGSGAVGWFNPQTLTGAALSRDFDRFYYPGNVFSLGRQLAWIDERLGELGEGRRLFVFLNVGETHVPYWHEGASWSRDSPCVPFGENNDRSECRRRQKTCLEWVDAQLAPLLQRFAHANTLVCADHGDAWGEDGVWNHGFHHPKVLEVPLLFRLSQAPQRVSAEVDAEMLASMRPASHQKPADPL